MKPIISAAILAISVSTVAFAQQPATTTAGPAEIFTRLPAGTTVTNFYKQNVYDPSDNKIGDVDDVLIDKEGRVTAMILGVGGFLGRTLLFPSAPCAPARKTINGTWS
jgi:sporulation protein YlmC with PRC-barrel domain